MLILTFSLIEGSIHKPVLKRKKKCKMFSDSPMNFHLILINYPDFVMPHELAAAHIRLIF